MSIDYRKFIILLVLNISLHHATGRAGSGTSYNSIIVPVVIVIALVLVLLIGLALFAFWICVYAPHRVIAFDTSDELSLIDILQTFEVS